MTRLDSTTEKSDLTRHTRSGIAYTVLLAVVLLSLMACSSGERSTPSESAWFIDEARSRGVDFMHVSGYAQRPLLPEIVGSGVALVDVDGDNDLDIYFIQSGWNLDDPPQSLDESVPGNVLYLNNGAAMFERSTHGGASEDKHYGMGVAVGDYDNDGDEDLYVTNLGRNRLLQNDGVGFFTDKTEEAGVDDLGWGTAAAFVDFDLDGDLDLFVVNYLSWSPGTEIDCYARGELTYCLPTNYQAQQQDRLYRNNGDGTFLDVSEAAGIHASYGNGLGLVSADFNGDHLMDVFVANDTMVNQLWINQGNFTFKDEAVLWGCAVDDHGIAKAGMGVDTADVDDDGDFDVLVVNFEGQTDSLFRNENRYFVDSTSEAQLATDSRRHTRFGVVLADFNNDTLLDLYEANGKVDGEAASTDDVFAEPNLLLRGTDVDGKRGFTSVLPIGGTDDFLLNTSRGLAAGDLNNDGWLDLVVANRDAAPYLLMNQGPTTANWIQFTVKNHMDHHAYGAVVSGSVQGKRIYRIVKRASSYLASHDPRIHFGLGDARELEDVAVTWLGGETQDFGDFQADQIVELVKR